MLQIIYLQMKDNGILNVKIEFSYKNQDKY